MEHIEEAGVHSGDSACAIPPYSLPGPVVAEIREATCDLARHLRVKGLMNVQFAVKKENGRPVVYVLEVNPRASRTVPFVSKATGVPLAKVAAKVMVGVSLAEQGIYARADPQPRVGQGERVPLRQVPRRGHRARAGDEIHRRSDGHRATASRSPSPRARLAAGTVLPHQRQDLHQRGRARQGARGRIWPGGWRSWASICWPPAARPSVWKRRASRCTRVKKIQEGHPNLLDFCSTADLRLVINTPSGKGARTDEGRIRSAAVFHGIPCITTIQAAQAAVKAMEALREEELTVQAIQDRFPAYAHSARKPAPAER